MEHFSRVMLTRIVSGIVSSLEVDLPELCTLEQVYDWAENNYPGWIVVMALICEEVKGSGRNWKIQ